LIADLIETKGRARKSDIAKVMNISHVTTLRTLQRLQRDGYVETGPRQPIQLTQKGKQLASLAKKRHQILLEFLIKIGVPPHIAQLDAEGMEHHISQETLETLQAHLKTI
jgi:DtxR family manganese transport transcriptional regulator